MEYKLFIFGTPGLFDTVGIAYDMGLKIGDVIIHKDIRYKILDFVRFAIPVVMDDNNRRVFENQNKDPFKYAPHLIITEIPTY